MSYDAKKVVNSKLFNDAPKLHIFMFLATVLKNKKQSRINLNVNRNWQTQKTEIIINKKNTLDQTKDLQSQPQFSSFNSTSHNSKPKNIKTLFFFVSVLLQLEFTSHPSLITRNFILKVTTKKCKLTA